MMVCAATPGTRSNAATITPAACQAGRCLLALSGFRLNLAGGSIAFAPAMPGDDFRCFFSAGTGWGSLVQQRAKGTLEADLTLDWGMLQLREVSLQSVGAVGNAAATLNDIDLPVRLQLSGNSALVEFEQQVKLAPGDRLSIRLTGSGDPAREA